MATNKNAIVRYQTLDKCFSNFGRMYYLSDLLEKVNENLIDLNGEKSGIKERQLWEDIKFMRSDAGYSAPIDAIREGREKAYYRYEDKNFSINNSPLNTTEAEQLKNALTILKRFEGSPQFEWVQELNPILTDQFGLEENDKKVMALESNIDYSGYKFISPIFSAITNKRVLEIEYQPFGKSPLNGTFHPYFLKQYNNRWFVFGRLSEKDINTWSFPLDRINNLTETSQEYQEDETDWEDYFYDIIGVTRMNGEVQTVKLLFTKEQAPYIITKPLHPTQRTNLLDTGELEIRIEVISNYELETKLLSFGEKVNVLEPIELKNKIKERLINAQNLYA